MKSLPAAVVLEKNRRASPYAWLALLDIELTNGNDYHIVRNQEDVVFLDDDYVAAGCIGHWKLDDDAADTDVLDSSGNSNDGTLNGGGNTQDKSVTGKVGEAFLFNGIDDFVNCGNDSSLDWGLGDGSVALWFKLDTIPVASADYICIKGAWGAGQKRYALRITSTNGYGEFEIDDDTIEKDVTGSVNLCDDNWHLLIGVRDGNNLRLYVDGIEAATATDITGYGSLDDTEPFTIGAINASGSPGSANHFPGSIDNVMICNRALTQADVDVLYNAKSDYAAAGCVGHWKLDDYAADTVVLDSSGNGNDGTLEGSDNTDVKSVVGKVRGAFQFNSIDDYVNLSDVGLTIADDYAISVWVKPASLSSLRSIFVHNATSSDRVGIATNGVTVYGQQWDGGSWTGVHSTLTIGVWNHIVYSKLDGVKTIYINGVASTTSGNRASWDGVLDCYLGAALASPVDEFFDGIIDNVMAFTRGLTQADVTFLYNNGNGTELTPESYGVGTELVPVVYDAQPFQMESYDQSVGGGVTTVHLRVPNILRLLETDLQALDGAGGSTIKLRVVNSGRITEDYAELTLNFQILSTVVTDEFVDFELGLPSVLRERYPLWRYLPTICVHTYTGGVANSPFVECGYVGGLTTCEKTLDDCINHSNETRFGGFPGLRRGVLRLV